MNTTQLLKQAAESLSKVRDENRKLAEDNATKTEKIATLERKDQSLQLAIQIAEKEGFTDWHDLLKKAQEINDSPRSLEVIAAGIELAGAKDFSIGKVAEGHQSSGGGSPEDVFISFLMSEE